MFNRNPIPAGIDDPTQPSRTVAITVKSRILEIWHIQRIRTVYKERDLELPKELRTRIINGQRQRYNAYRRQVAHQEWGHYRIRRYQATRIIPWMPTFGLSMLIPATLMAAGTASQGLMHAPIGPLILQSLLITVGGMMLVGSGWHILQRLQPWSGVELESLGVSGHALGFPKGTKASDTAPAGFRAGRFVGAIEVEGAAGEWRVVAEQEADGEFHLPEHLRF
jgi:hypothetical protein